MRYRVAFAKRFESDGRESSTDPTAQLDVLLPEGMVADKAFVERLEPLAQHNQEVLDEDDAFLASAAPEVWEYDVVDERASEFENAVRETETVIEFDVVDETVTEAGEVVNVALSDSDPNVPDERENPAEVTQQGSGVRAGDDGPAGQPTVDPSAGGMAPGKAKFGLEEVEGVGIEGSGGIDDLTIVDENDRRLGLTNRGGAGPDDWAANRGPSRTPDRGVETDNPVDRSSTLSPRKRR